MRAVCPGSFDPVTSGHIDIFARAARLCDHLVIAVVHNPRKSGLFDPPTRLELIRSGLGDAGVDLGNIEFDEVPGGLLVDYCARIGATALVKGLRTATDYSYELPMAQMNRHLADIETVFLAGDPAREFVSSSLVKEVASHGGDISGLVPEAAARALREKYGS